MSKPLNAQATFMVLDLFNRDRGVVEVRLPHTPKGTVSGYFSNHTDLVAAVARWNGLASIYLTINRLNPAVLARARNRLETFARITSGGEDIQRRLWFAIDVDSVRPRGIPATDVELTRALTRRDHVITYLCESGAFPSPLRIMSGNGGWALWAADLDNTDEVTFLYRAALTALDQRFSDSDAKVDPAIVQPAQIMKLPMTIAIKGDELPGRPHRRVEIQSPVPPHLLDPTQIELVTHKQLRWLGAQVAPRRTYSLPSTPKDVDLVALFKARGLYLRELPDA